MTAQVTRPAFADKIPHAVTFTAWRVTEYTALNGCQMLDVSGAADLHEAAAAALAKCSKGDAFYVVVQDSGQASHVVHPFTVHLSAKHASTVRKPGMAHTVKQGRMMAKPGHPFPVAAIGVKPAFDAFRDDPVGVDRTLVEQS